jgi:ABC-2 type transport system permease protein
VNDILVIVQTEILRRIRSRPYLIGTILGAFGLLTLALLPAIIDRTFVASGRAIILAGTPRLIAAATPLLAGDYRIVRTLGAMPAHPSLADLDRGGRRAAALVALRDDHGLHVTVYARDVAGDTPALRHDLVPLNIALNTHLAAEHVDALLTVPVETHSFDRRFGEGSGVEAAQAVAIFLVTILYIAIIINAQNILGSVAEEKTNRIAELLVACVPPSRLLAGKVLAAGATAAVQIIIWGVVVVLFLLPFAQPIGSAPGGSGVGTLFASVTGTGGGVVSLFVVFFFIGFAEFALLYAAAGSLISRTEDIGSVAGPLVVPVVAGFLLAQAAVNVPNQAQVVLLSFVPLVSPFVMFGRIAVSSVPAAQIAIAIAINLVTIVAIAVGSGKIYRVGLLTHGRPPKLSHVWAILRS